MPSFKVLNPSFPWALTTVIGQMAQSFVIGQQRTVRMCYFVTYSRNRIRLEFLTTRLGDCEPTLFW